MAEWCKPGQLPKGRIKRKRSRRKVMATVFWDSQGVILVDCLDSGETMNTHRFCTSLLKLRDRLRQLRPETFASTLLLYDNAPPHRASKGFAQELGFEVLPHPAYSPDLSPCDFYLFPALKREMKGEEFDTDEHVARFAYEWLDAVADVKENFYRDGMMKLIR